MSVTFLLLVLENLNKYHTGDFAGHCSVYYYYFGGGGGGGIMWICLRK